MSAFAEAVRSGEWLGATGRRIRAVVNIGIGGSDLGPAMAYAGARVVRHARAHRAFRLERGPGRPCRATKDLDPAETLFVVVSKTMSTLETIENAHAAREWLVAALGSDADLDASLRRGGGKTRSRRAHRGAAGERVSHVGLGRRPDVSLLRGRALPADRARRRALPRASRWLPRHGRPLRHRRARREPPRHLRPAVPLVPELHGRGDHRGRAVQPCSPAASRLSPAALDGVEREVGHDCRRAGRGRLGVRPLGRCGHERPARGLPAPPSGNRARARRPDRLRAVVGTCGGAARPAGGEPLRAGRGACLRAHGGRARRSRRTRGDDPAPGDAGEPPELGDSRRAPHSGHSRCARGAVRAQRLHAGGDLGDQPLRPVGRRARKGARVADRPGARDGTGSTSSCTTRRPMP